MPLRLHRYYGAGYLHFITFSCYHRRQLLRTPQRRDLFLKFLEQVRLSYKFVVVGYVVMPEHVHLLLSEPERANPSVVVQVLKQRFARQVGRARRQQQSGLQRTLWEADCEDHVWQRRFYAFVVWSEHKRAEKLRYMHNNPVKRGLVLSPEQWPWSSFRFYTHGERGPVLVNELKPAGLKLRGRAAAM
jgi:putative transposase